MGLVQATVKVYSMAMATELGNGETTLFWQDRWLLGQRIQELAPRVYGMIPRRIINRRTVAEALDGARWVRDIHGTMSWELVQEFIWLWEAIAEISLQEGTADRHYWRLSSSGCYSAHSAYLAIFQGSTLFAAHDRIWKAWAPPKCKFFMWLVAHNRFWTADRLAKRNLPHPDPCVLCDQGQETIDHLLLSCVFTRRFWFILLQRIGLAELAPQLEDLFFEEWWSRVYEVVGPALKRGLHSLIILGAWTIWKYRNDCVLNSKPPSLATALVLAGDEIWSWNMAGARDLSLLVEQAQFLG